MLVSLKLPMEPVEDTKASLGHYQSAAGTTSGSIPLSSIKKNKDKVSVLVLMHRMGCIHSLILIDW